MAELTAEELTAGISNAIKAHDWDAVVDMLRALVFIDPQRALDIYDMLATVTFTGTVA
jgi:hypothetical protein